MKNVLVIVAALLLAGALPCAQEPRPEDRPRAEEFTDLRFGMFICWSFSTFANVEWTRGVTDLAWFNPTGCDVEQWCRTAKEAEMGYILLLSKHHDGFCLWDTDTTEWKVTNSPLGIDVVAEARRWCDHYGLGLAFYFSEGDWTWPGGADPEQKKAQLRELLTGYGPIEFFWMDHAQTDGGLSHEDTAAFCKSIQPRCLVGFNHGEPAGDLRLGEYGRPTPLGDASGAGYGAKAAAKYTGYVAAEFTYPILGEPKNRWFYTIPEWDDRCRSAEEIYATYLEAVKVRNVFSLDVGPDRAGKLRDIDVRTLQTVGRYIRGELTPPPPPLTRDKACSASSTWQQNAGYEPDKAFDGLASTRWGASEGATSAWLAVDLGEPTLVDRVVVDEGTWNRVRRYEIQCGDGETWTTLLTGERLGQLDTTIAPTRARWFRLRILEATQEPTILELQLFAPSEADEEEDSKAG